jgi:hypothetical protein
MSQSEVIALTVDPANDGNPETQNYANQQRKDTFSLYREENSDLKNRDELRLAATLPKRSGNFPGVVRSEARFTKTVEVEGVDTTTTVAGVATGIISFSLPLGTSAATATLLRQRMIGLLDDDDIMDDLTLLGEQ